MERFQIAVKVVQFHLLMSQLAVAQIGQKAEQDGADSQKEYKENILRKKGVQFSLRGVCRRFPLGRCHVTPSLSYGAALSKFSLEMQMFSR